MCALHPDYRRSGLADLIELQVETIMESVTNSSVILLLTKMKDKKQTNIVYYRTWNFSKLTKYLKLLKTSPYQQARWLRLWSGEMGSGTFRISVRTHEQCCGSFLCTFLHPDGDHLTNKKKTNKNKKERNQENLSVGLCCSGS